MATEWRTRWTHAQTRGRTIERQAEGLRHALVRLSDGTGPVEDLERSIRVLRDQLELVERVAAEWRR